MRGEKISRFLHLSSSFADKAPRQKAIINKNTMYLFIIGSSFFVGINPIIIHFLKKAKPHGPMAWGPWPPEVLKARIEQIPGK
jgi:hypothetical protein